jgi:hypothetical protein
MSGRSLGTLWENFALYATLDIVTDFGVCDYRRGMDWMNWIYWPLVRTTRNYTSQNTDTHRLVSSFCYSLHQPFPSDDFYRERFFSFPHSGPLVTVARAGLLSIDNSTTGVPGWRPFHTNRLLFSSEADFHLAMEISYSPTSYFTSLHSAQLLTTSTNS